MRTAELLRQIKQTDRAIKHAQHVITAYQLPTPYCYLLPLFAFFVGYSAQSKVSTSTILQLVKAQLMLNTLLETQARTQI